MNKVLLSTLLLIFSLSTFAVNDRDDDNNDLMAEITLNDGTTFEAAIKLPTLESKTVTYYDPVSGKKRKLKSSDISSMVVWRNPHRNESYQFIYTSVRTYGLTFKKNEITKKSRWITLMATRKHIKLYRSGEEYQIRKKNGELRLANSSNQGLTVKTYYLQRMNEEIPTEIGHNSLAYDFMITTGKLYFSDCPEMLKLVRDKTWKKKRLPDLINYYEKISSGE